MSDGGKGSKPRPYSVDYDKFSENWNTIFRKQKYEKEILKNEYYDILTTEDCFPDIKE